VLVKFDQVRVIERGGAHVAVVVMLNAVAKVPSRRYRNTESRVPSTFLSIVTLNDIYDVHLRA